VDLIVRIGSLTFWGNRSQSGYGFFIGPDGFEGWDDGVDVKRDGASRPQAHGDFDVPGFLESRVVSLSGDVVVDPTKGRAWMRSALTGLGADGNSMRVVVEHNGETQWADGRLALKTKFKATGTDKRHATFQLQLWFANPRKFGDAVAFPNAKYSLAEVHHRGNFAAVPIHTVTGSMPAGYTINGPAGKKFTVTAPVTSGNPHVIDMATGRVTVNGSVVLGAVTRGDTWSIPGGAQVIHSLSPVSGSGSLSTLVKDTFI
jgi:hypothetical protein